MSFANPWAFLLLVPLFISILWILNRGVRKRSRLFIPTDDWYAGRPKSWKPTPFKLHFFLRTLSLIFLVVAIARPQESSSKVKKKIEAIDIMICFDLSKSMDALDFKPNRRGVAIKTISEFIDNRNNDRIGLVLFSGEAYLAVPVTHDHKMLKESILNSSSKNMQDGTAIGQSIAVGVNHLRKSTAKSRIVILVTDGDNNMGSVDPETAAVLAEGFGIRVYTIGLGKKGRVPFPEKRVDAYGREIEVLRYLTDAVNDELLQSIADRTGGRFFKATEGAILEKVFQTIDKLEKTKVEVNLYL